MQSKADLYSTEKKYSTDITHFRFMTFFFTFFDIFFLSLWPPFLLFIFRESKKYFTCAQTLITQLNFFFPSLDEL